MKLADEIRIRTQPEEVWPHVGDPKGWLGFHPKVVTVRQTAGSGPAVDAWYEIEFEMNGHSLLHRVRVRERFDIRNHGIPWPFTILISWIHRTGIPQGTTGLEPLRELLEHQAVPA